MPSFDIDSKRHREQRTQEKIRTRAEKGSTPGEQKVAQSKLRRPEELPPKFPKLNVGEAH